MEVMSLETFVYSCCCALQIWYYCNMCRLSRIKFVLPYLQGLSSDLTRPPDTLEDLKFVLSAIAKIRSMSLEVEIQYR